MIAGKDILVYDLEVFPNFFSATFKLFRKDAWKVFTAGPSHLNVNDIPKLAAWLEKCGSRIFAIGCSRRSATNATRRLARSLWWPAM